MTKIPSICLPFLRDIARNPFSVHARMAFLDFLDERESPIQEKHGKDIIEYHPQYFKDWSEFIKCHMEMEKQSKGRIVASKKNDEVQDHLDALHERLLDAHSEWIKLKCPNPNCDSGRDSTLGDVSSFCLTCGGSEDLLKTARGDQPQGLLLDVRRRNVAWFQGHIVRVSCTYAELGKMGSYKQGEFRLDVSKWCTALCGIVPVVNFYITDKTPFHITEWGLRETNATYMRYIGKAEERGNFFFRAWSPSSASTTHYDIESYIFDHLEGYTLIEDEPTIKFYKTLAQANGALGLACGKVVRSRINWEDGQWS